MSRSIHTTTKDLKGLTKKELEEQAHDPTSDLSALVNKSSIKKKVKKNRKAKKMKNQMISNLDIVIKNNLLSK